MKVSIVITSYNYERYLEAAIDSALAQTYPHTEVVVIDDGSTDGSQDIMRRYEGRAKLIFKQNGGQGSAFNIAYLHTTGEGVLFLDSDDVLEPNAVAEVVKVWRPGYSKVHFPLRIVDETGRATGGCVPRAPLPQGSLAAELLETGMYVSPPNTGNVFCRRFLDQVLPMPEKEWVYGPDCYLVFLAPFFGEVGAVQQPLGLYRRHTASVTNITKATPEGVVEKLLDMLENDRKLRRLLEKFSRDQGLSLAPEAVTSHWLHLKLRLALRKLGYAIDPSEGAARLCARMLRSVWSASDLNLRGRMEFTAWVLLVASLPGKTSMPLIRLAFAPGDRPAVIRTFLGLPAS
ncbi:MAG: glycosyltransferase [Bryobacteraceae bacterium]|nr:glycosyltransferase [Bryobacteraceae bacterium]